MLGHILKFFPLALSTGVLICMAIVFSGCTSTSSPGDLYFMKVNLTSFSTITPTHLRRGISFDSLDSATPMSEITSEGGSLTSSAETSVAQVSTSIQTAGVVINNSIQEISNALKLNLPAYYTIGLLGYCEGYGVKATYCSDPSTSFFFNMTMLFGKASPDAPDVIPGLESRALRGYQYIAQWCILANILGLVFTFATVVFGITTMMSSWGRIFLVISHLLATIFVTAATISTTVIYGLMITGIKAVLQNFGITANFGGRTFTAAWLGVFFSFGALLTCMVELFCCCI